MQTLYSFLLVEKQFTLEDAPAKQTKEREYSYALYLEMLALLVRVSDRIERRRGEFPLRDTRFISRLRRDARIESILRTGALPGEDPVSLDAIMQLTTRVADAVAESGVYKHYLKDLDKDIPAAEERMWGELLNLVIMQHPEVVRYMSERNGATLKGAERVKEMLNRTLVNFLASNDNVNEAVGELEKSLEKARELYFRLLWLPVELTDMQERILDDNRNKFLRSDEDLNPNMKFVDNRLVEILRNDARLASAVKERGLGWRQTEPIMMDRLLGKIKESEIYAEYMASDERSLQEDADFWRKIMKHVVMENPTFLETLEEESVFWNDDLDITATFVQKTIKKIVENPESSAILDKYKDEEDARFGAELLRAVYAGKGEYRDMIATAVAEGNWDADRLAFMDVVILETALAEIINFPKIPLRVSINEYIEMAKSYSTTRSGMFVNGMLATMVGKLQEEGKIIKK